MYRPLSLQPRYIECQNSFNTEIKYRINTTSMSLSCAEDEKYESYPLLGKSLMKHSNKLIQPAVLFFNAIYVPLRPICAAQRLDYCTRLQFLTCAYAFRLHLKHANLTNTCQIYRPRMIPVRFRQYPIFW